MQILLRHLVVFICKNFSVFFFSDAPGTSNEKGSSKQVAVGRYEDFSVMCNKRT